MKESKKKIENMRFKGKILDDHLSARRPMSCLAVTFMAQQINSLKQERNVVFIAVFFPDPKIIVTDG